MPVATQQNRLTRKEKRVQKENKEVMNEKFNFTLRRVSPLTDNQKYTFEAYDNNKHLLLIGTAGTGKSFLSIYLGIQDIMERQSQKKMVIIRSVVSSRDIGYLPGNNKEKSKVYEAPYYAIFSELFCRGDAYEYLKNKNVVEFINTSFVRGITLNNCIVVVDEIQNMTWHELSSVFTRIGKNCRIIFVGDTRQNDLHSKRGSEASGIEKLIHVLSLMKEFGTITFKPEDIVRSEIIKSFIMTCDKLGY